LPKPKVKTPAPAKRAPPPPPEDDPNAGSKLPSVSVIDDQDAMDACVEMLQEAEDLKRRSEDDLARLKEIRTELSVYSEAYDLPGMRWGKIGLIYNGMRKKLTLDKAKLLENGVTAEQIGMSYKESDEFVDARFVNLK